MGYIGLAFIVLMLSTSFASYLVTNGNIQNPVYGLAHPIERLKNSGMINVHNTYNSSLAPRGISFLGIGKKGPCYVKTDQVKGVVKVYRLSAISKFKSNTTENAVSFELNAVLTYWNDNRQYALWIQDVSQYNMGGSIEFWDNIWNMSAPKAGVRGVVGNGLICYNEGVSFYFDSASGYPGGFVGVKEPFSVSLMMNVSNSSKGCPVIYFWYNDGHGWINYDQVTVRNAPRSSNISITINGNEYTPDGLYYDLELVMGGVDDGACANVSNSEVELSICYFNGHNFQEPINTYNFGVDTAETVSNVKVSCRYNVTTGQLSALLSQGNSSSLTQLWNGDNVSLIRIVTDHDVGCVVGYNPSYPISAGLKLNYLNNEAILVLHPMRYGFLSVVNGKVVGEASTSLSPGSNYTVFAPQLSTSPTVDYLYLVPGNLYHENLTLNGFGNVTVSCSNPEDFPISGLTGTYYVNQSILLNFSVSPPSSYSFGEYMIYLTLTLLPGINSTSELRIYLVPKVVNVTFLDKFIGISSSNLSILLIFPNGSNTTIIPGEHLILPTGSKYFFLNYTSGDQRWVTLNSAGVIENSSVILATYYQQFYLNFSFSVTGGKGYLTPNVTFCYFSRNATLPVGLHWVNARSYYNYSRILYAPNEQERWVAYSSRGIVMRPNQRVDVLYYNEYYLSVNSLFPIKGYVNSTLEQITSGWYLEGTKVIISNYSIYISQDEREILGYINTGLSFSIVKPIEINGNWITQFYLNVSSPIPVFGEVNGTNESVTSGWYNANTSFVIENVTIYKENGTRYVITEISPRSFTLNSPFNLTVEVIRQEYLTVLSTIPVKAFVNGSCEIITSNWFPYNSNVILRNYTYYVNNDTRKVITNASWENITLTSPSVLKVYTVTQFLVTINGRGTWLNEGSTLILNASIPIYDKGEFEGTFTLAPGSKVIVEEPINENLAISLKLQLVISIATGIVLLVVIVFLWYRKK
ncbi:thermopsin [Sulfolobales archaeon HS-7]|nr:thermopsin [Sulfolobales archaeon HS-7]